MATEGYLPTGSIAASQIQEKIFDNESFGLDEVRGRIVWNGSTYETLPSSPISYNDLRGKAYTYTVDVLMIGGGGGGGYGEASPVETAGSGGGGGAGQLSIYYGIRLRNTGENLYVKIGQGGAGGSNASSTGSNGTYSSFNENSVTQVPRNITSGGGGGGSSSSRIGQSACSSGGASVKYNNNGLLISDGTSTSPGCSGGYYSGESAGWETGERIRDQYSAAEITVKNYNGNIVSYSSLSSSQKDKVVPSTATFTGGGGGGGATGPGADAYREIVERQLDNNTIDAWNIIAGSGGIGYNLDIFMGTANFRGGGGGIGGGGGGANTGGGSRGGGGYGWGGSCVGDQKKEAG